MDKEIDESVIVDAFTKAIEFLQKDRAYEKAIDEQVKQHADLLKRLKDA